MAVKSLQQENNNYWLSSLKETSRINHELQTFVSVKTIGINTVISCKNVKSLYQREEKKFKR